MESLTLNKAMELYEILGAHIPDVEDENIDAIEFIGKIVQDIKDSDEHRHYIDAVILMSNKTWEEVRILESDEVLNLFINGLVTNRIIHLKSFCTEIGFSYA